MKRNHNILPAILCAGLAACSTNPGTENQVHLQGQLIDMGTQEVTMRYDGAASEVGDSRDILLHTDAEGRFDTVIALTEPAYYSISRNTLYLTPGDDLTVKITTNNAEAEFSGQGASVNNYMKHRLFPKGGSFLEGGSNVRSDFAATKTLIDSLAAMRRAQLDTLGQASETFKDLERARITADVANSYLCYMSYSKLARTIKTPEEFMQKLDSFYQAITPEVKPIFQQLNQDKYLDVAVVRDVMRYVATPGTADGRTWNEGLTLSARAQELYGASKEVGKLRKRVDQATLEQAKAYAAGLQNQDFATELNAKIEQAAKLVKGQPAIDFEFTDADGNTHRLSEFKGKVLYLDFWATWCGPCIQESPFFEKLAKEFAGKEIVFLPISTDTSQKAWKSFIAAHKKELTQYNTVDETIREGWAIFYIPRFVIIDKDFNIVDAYAPRPSEPAAKELLESLLK